MPSPTRSMVVSGNCIAALYQRLQRLATVLIELVQRPQLVDITVGVLHAVAAVGQEADVLALLHAELDRPAVRLHAPLLEAEAHVDRFEPRNLRDEHRAGKVFADETAQRRLQRRDILDYH